MINSTVFNIALTNAAALQAATGKRIAATNRSMLSNLVGLSYVGDVPQTGEITYGDVLQAVTQDSVDGPSLHTNALANEIETLTPMVANHIAFIRNTVCPKVHSFEEVMANAVARVNDHDPLAAFEVVQVSPPNPVTNEDFMELVQRFADANMSAPAGLGNFPPLSKEDIARAMEVSSASVNESIKNWIAERGENWLTDIWHYYFAQASTRSSGTHGYAGGWAGIAAQTPFQRLDTALAIFLIARGLYDEPVENAAVSLSDWRSIMDQASRFAGAQAMAALRLVDTTNRQEVLILGISDQGKRVTVNSPIYTRYLEEGGKVDDVLGAAISGKMMQYSLVDMRENGQEYAKIFSSYRSITQNNLAATAVMRLRAEAKAAFAHALEGMSEDEIEVLSAQNRTAASLQELAEREIDAKVLPQLENVGHLAIELIAGIRFAHTPARQFLLDMEAAEEAGCTCPQEAAAVAALNYLCSYAASNLALVN